MEFSLGLLIVLLVGLGVLANTIYNKLVRLKNQAKNAWAQIDVQLKRRHDLIPNLVETVKGYMTHERQTIEAVIKARQQAVQISGEGNVEQSAKIESMLSQTLKSLFAVSENYPELKANENFAALQEEITSTENKISFARQFYNDTVMTFNTAIELFPNNIFAGIFSFKHQDYFEITVEAEKEAPKVAF